MRVISSCCNLRKEHSQSSGSLAGLGLQVVLSSTPGADKETSLHPEVRLGLGHTHSLYHRRVLVSPHPVTSRLLQDGSSVFLNLHGSSGVSPRARSQNFSPPPPPQSHRGSAANLHFDSLAENPGSVPHLLSSFGRVSKGSPSS